MHSSFILKLLLKFCVILICTNGEKRKSYKNYKILELEGNNRDVKRLIDYIRAIDVSTTNEIASGKTQVLLQPALLSRVQKFAKKVNVNINIIVRDYSKILKKETKKTLRGSRASALNFSWYDYYDVDDIYTYLKMMQERHPYASSLTMGGESFLGQKILGIRIFTNVPVPRNKRKPVVVIEAGAHAREWLTPAVTTYFIHQLLKSNTNEYKNMRDSFDWRIFPTTNPDGYRFSLLKERMWRKTRSRTKGSECIGVDLNRNWDYKFRAYDSSSNPCDYQTYAGKKPFSEIESRSLSAYISKIDNLLAYISIHSYAKSILVPYGDGTLPENYTAMVEIANHAVKRSGIKYLVGTGVHFLGKISGTSVDWVYKTKKPPMAFTLEMNANTFFTPSHDIIESGEQVSVTLLGLFEQAKKQGLYEYALRNGFV